MPQYSPVTIEELLPKLRCPQSFESLHLDNHHIRAEHSAFQYDLSQGSPDLMRSPKRLNIDMPWYEPWDDLDVLELSFPTPIKSPDLPYHLDGHLASIPGEIGDDRWILEVGCGERQCEKWFVPRGFRYVGTDADRRGIGPHLMADAHNLPFVDQSFDFYTSMAVYEHIVSPLTASMEAFRILKPGGIFFGSTAFVYGFHDRASFHHMSHAGILYILRAAGFQVERIWPDWDYTSSMAEMGFRGTIGAPWRYALKGTMTAAEWTFTRMSSVARKVTGKPPLDLLERRVHAAGSLSFCARRPLES